MIASIMLLLQTRDNFIRVSFFCALRMLQR